MNLDAIYKITPNVAINIGVFMFSFVCPGFLLWYLISPDLFIKLDFLKLFVLGVAISAPTFFVPYMFSFICFLMMKKNGADRVELYGGPKSWYLRHGMNNAVNMYIVVALCYLFGTDGVRLFCFIMGMAIFGVVQEIYNAFKFARDPCRLSSITIFNENSD
ncbi:MAG: hypothetical protein ACK4TD_11760 [Ectopseudomonas guguanensis]|uniref:hypothetical protein n=1 Tax=Ectopseudomonas guguanensis TaxID=1198456 RepID=UPI00391C17E2